MTLCLSQKYAVFCLLMETVAGLSLFFLSPAPLSTLLFLSRQHFLQNESASPVTLYLGNYFPSAKPHCVECRNWSGLNKISVGGRGLNGASRAGSNAILKQVTILLMGEAISFFFFFFSGSGRSESSQDFQEE